MIEKHINEPKEARNNLWIISTRQYRVYFFANWRLFFLEKTAQAQIVQGMTRSLLSRRGG